MPGALAMPDVMARDGIHRQTPLDTNASGGTAVTRTVTRERLR
jgi:hypothetical protein